MFRALCEEYGVKVRYKHGEVPVVIGVIGDKNIMKVYVNPETSAFSLTLEGADGSMCLIRAGKDFTFVPPKAPTKPGT